jgi:hypothetical protein
MKGLILGVLLSGAYVLGMVALFSTDYAKKNDFLFAEKKQEVHNAPVHTGFGTLVKLQDATPAAANDTHDLP